MNNESYKSFHKIHAQPGLLEATGMQYHQYKWKLYSRNKTIPLAQNKTIPLAVIANIIFIFYTIIFQFGCHLNQQIY